MKTIFFLSFFLCFTLHSFAFEDFKEGNIEYVWDRTELYEEGLQVYHSTYNPECYLGMEWVNSASR